MPLCAESGNWLELPVQEFSGLQTVAAFAEPRVSRVFDGSSAMVWFAKNVATSFTVTVQFVPFWAQSRPCMAMKRAVDWEPYSRSSNCHIARDTIMAEVTINISGTPTSVNSMSADP